MLFSCKDTGNHNIRQPRIWQYFPSFSIFALQKQKMTAAQLFESFSRVNVLIVGDVMIDRYVAGDVHRISPEAPVPVVQWQSEEDRLGGAANVALNIRAMGATPYLCSVIGDDEDGARFLQLLPEQQLPQEGLLKSPERPTTVKTRIMAGKQQLLRIDRETTQALSEAENHLLMEGFRKLLQKKTIHLILFQDYNKGVLTPENIPEILREAAQRGIPTAVDPKFHNFWAFQGVTLFKPNLKEIRAQAGMPVLPELRSLQQASALIRDKLHNRYTMITLSEKGLFLDDGDASRLIPTHPRSIADVSGAGDTVISIAALGLAAGLDMEQTAILANLAGGQVCEHLGVVPVNREQLLQEYEALQS